jgi:hypothetical protein
MRLNLRLQHLKLGQVHHLTIHQHPAPFNIFLSLTAGAADLRHQGLVQTLRFTYHIHTLASVVVAAMIQSA